MATTKITSSDLLEFNDTTGAVRLPVGTTAERPVSASNGDLRFNTDTSLVEYYDGSAWREFDSYNPDVYDIDFLIVGGGGNGGNFPSSTDAGSGGSSGGLRTSYGTISGGGCSLLPQLSLNAGTTYTISVGGANNDSYISGSGMTTITGVAGPNGVFGNNQSGPAGIACNQYNGGAADANGMPGGGGGAGAAGNVGIGGDGLQISITGAATYYAGGGGGGTVRYTYRKCQPGGAGGGGRGAGTTIPGYYACPAGNGSANTGGGGGGCGYYDVTSPMGPLAGGTGGSGVVILRIPNSFYTGNTTGSPVVTIDGTDTVIKYTGSGTYTA